MKKISKITGLFLGLAMAIGVGAGIAVNSSKRDAEKVSATTGSYVITFKDTGTANDGSAKKTTVADLIASGEDYIASLGTTDNLYQAKSGYGIKGGTSSAKGMIVINWNTTDYAVKPTSIVAKIAIFDNSNDLGNGVLWGYNSSTSTAAKSGGATLTDYTIDLDGETDLSSITVAGKQASKARFYLERITVNYEVAEPVVSSVTLSPSTDVTLKEGEDQEFEVGISGTNLTGNETVSISYDAVIGDAGDISIDTASGLKNGDTFTVTAVNGGAAGEITATYGTGAGAVSSEPVTIYTEEPKTLKSLAITTGGTAKTSYVVGESFNPAGLTVTATFEDNTQEDVTSKVTWTPSVIAANTEEVVASYTEVATKTASFAISVETDYITNVIFNTSNAKTKYSLGDSFVASETGVTATTKYVVAADGSLTAGQLTYSGYNMNSEGNQTVTVSYPNPKSETPFSTTYSINVSKVVVSSVEDSITVSDTSVSGTSYTDMTPFSKSSPAVYDGACAGGDSSNPNTIQIRSKNSDSGLIVTTSGGYVRKLTMSLVSGNGVDVYAKTSAYEAASDLFNSTARGTEIATSVTPDANGNAVVELTAGTYTYFGIRSHSGASYISSLKVLWESSEAASDDVTEINDFIRDYMHLDYTKSEGFCKDSTNHWYTTAKSEFSSLSTNVKLILATSSTNYKSVTLDVNHKNNDDPESITYRYSDVKERFINWADFNGETITFNQTTGAIEIVSSGALSLGLFGNDTTTTISIIVIISVISVTAIGGFYFVRRRKEN